MNVEKYQAPQTEVESELVVIWQQLLKKERIGIYDNFFELGGTSFLAVKIVNRVKSLGYRLSLRDLFLNQSIAELSKKIGLGISVSDEGRNNNLRSNNAQDDYLIPIQKKGSLPPIFVVHSSWVYIQLASHLGKNQPLYCLDGVTLEKTEDIAAFYISKIKTVQSQGPYYLGGFCRHGLIALEMARQLAASGEEVGTLFLFETYSPAGVIPRLSWRYMKLSYNKLMNWPSLNRKKFLKDELRQAAKRLLLVSIKFVTKKHLVKTTSGKFALLKPRQIDLSYSGDVVIFRASSGEIWANDDPEMGWSKYFNGKIESFTIEGSHTDIFLEPGVQKLSKIMNRILANLSNHITTV